MDKKNNKGNKKNKDNILNKVDRENIINNSRGKKNNKENKKKIQKISDNIDNIIDEDLFDLEKLAIIPELLATKESLIALKYNLDERIYYDREVFPLLNTLQSLSFSTSNLANAAIRVAETNLGRKSKIKDTLDLVYDLVDECDDVYRCLIVKINCLLKISNCRR